MMTDRVVRQRIPSSEDFVRLPVERICCCCKYCGILLGHIRKYDGYGDFKCKNCKVVEAFVTDDIGNLFILTESASA